MPAKMVSRPYFRRLYKDASRVYVRNTGPLWVEGGSGSLRRSERITEALLWLGTDDAFGHMMFEMDSAIGGVDKVGATFFLSDPNTAFAFKMRFG